MLSKDIEKRISGKGRQGGSMNIRFSGFSNSLQSLNRRQSLTNILLNKQNVGQSGKKDLFVRSTTYDAGTYTISAGQRRKMIPGSVLAAMNNDISKVRKQGDIYECGGTFFTAEQIPKISGACLNEIKAEDNIIDFGKNKYFPYSLLFLHLNKTTEHIQGLLSSCNSKSSHTFPTPDHKVHHA